MGGPGLNSKWDYDEIRWVCITALNNRTSMALAVSGNYGVTEAYARALISKGRRFGYSIPYERNDLADDVAPPLQYEDAFTPEPWMALGDCVGVDPDLFFPGRGESSAPGKAVCAGCPVKAECLEYALRRGEKHGIWGGYSERERRTLRRNIRVGAA